MSLSLDGIRSYRSAGESFELGRFLAISGTGEPQSIEEVSQALAYAVIGKEHFREIDIDAAINGVRSRWNEIQQSNKRKIEFDAKVDALAAEIAMKLER